MKFFGRGDTQNGIKKKCVGWKSIQITIKSTFSGDEKERVMGIETHLF